jgi:hypothetical protein
MPMWAYEDEVEELCSVIEEILEQDGESATNTIKTGDWNNVVGDESHGNVGPHGFGRRNKRGQMLIEFCEKKWTCYN